MNLYYSLPESVIFKINKIIFDTHVLPKIKNRIVHGDFSFMLNKKALTPNWDSLWTMILHDFYSRLHRIGLPAWDYLYRKRNYIFLQSDEPIWITITEKLSEYGSVPFERGMLVMQHIARVGWDKFVEEYSIAMNLVN